MNNQNYPDYGRRDNAFEMPEVSFINKVYGTMTLGLLLPAFVAYYVYKTMPPETYATVMLPCCLAEVALLLVLSFMIMKLPPIVAFFMFLGYSALNGVTLSVLLHAYKITSVTNIFLTTAIVFGVMSVYGLVTRRDLTTIGNLALMSLLGIIIAMLVNIFLRSQMLDMMLSILGVLVFVVLTAYDTQKIKRIHEAGCNHTGIAIIGALSLYLDFINLFLHLIRLLGKRK